MGFGKVFRNNELQDQVFRTIHRILDSFYLHSLYSETLRRHRINIKETQNELIIFSTFIYLQSNRSLDNKIISKPLEVLYFEYLNFIWNNSTYNINTWEGDKKITYELLILRLVRLIQRILS